MFRISSFALLSTLLGAAPAWPALAQAGDSYLSGAHASGEWGGLREALDGRGVEVELVSIPMPSHPAPAAGLMLGARRSQQVRVLGGLFEGHPESGGTRAAVGEASAYLGTGAADHGLGQRQDDTVGAGVSTVWLQASAGQRAETVFELFYKARFTRFLSLQPDVQLFRNPRGQPGYGWVSTARLRLKV